MAQLIYTSSLSKNCYEHVLSTGKRYDMKFYMIAGEQESTGTIDVAEDMIAMRQKLLDAGFPQSKVIAQSHAEGQHAEWYWAEQFPAA